MQASVLPAAAMGMLGLVAAFGGMSPTVDGQPRDSGTAVVRLSDRGSAAPSGPGDSSARRPTLPDVAADRDRPVPMPEVEPRRPGPVPMPEVAPQRPGPVPMPHAGPRDPLDVQPPANPPDDTGRGSLLP